jgi:hypothetical protein
MTRVEGISQDFPGVTEVRVWSVFVEERHELRNKTLKDWCGELFNPLIILLVLLVWGESGLVRIWKYRR